MKSIVKNMKAKKVKPFPKLMICIDTVNTGMIILFTSKDSGTVISPGKQYNFGARENCWLASAFEEFEGSVTLSND